MQKLGYQHAFYKQENSQTKTRYFRIHISGNCLNYAIDLKPETRAFFFFCVKQVNWTHVAFPQHTMRDKRVGRCSTRGKAQGNQN